MTQAPRHRKTRPQSAPPPGHQRCSCCNALLTHPGTVIPGLGVFGPKCVLNAQARAQDLEQGGLGALLRAGELRFPMVRESDTVFRLPTEATAPYYAAAQRLGLELDSRTDGRERVISVRAKSLQVFLKKAAQA